MSAGGGTRSALLVAAVAAGVIVCYQVSVKATRDSLFLSSFDIKALVWMGVAAALTSMLLTLPAARLMTRAGPARTVPAAFWVSGILHLGEWALYLRSRNAAVILLYLHVATCGAVLVSGFWSIVNERFDPHTAKKKMANIAIGCSIGSVAGGLIGLILKQPSLMFPVVAAMHLACGWLVRALVSPSGRSAAAPDALLVSGRSAAGVLTRLTYLRQLALIVLLGSIASGLIGFTFMATAKSQFVNATHLFRFLLMVQMGADLIGIVIHAAVTNAVLEKAGLGVAVSILPATAAAGSLGTLFWPGLGSITALRGSELALRNSLFRSAYEIFFTAVPAVEKRAAKQIIDVGFERAGDIIASMLFGLALAHPIRGSYALASMAAAFISGLVGVWVALRLGRGYVIALERNLRERAVDLNLQDVADQTTRAVLTRTTTQIQSAVEGTAAEPQRTDAQFADPMLRRIADLRSSHPSRIRQALKGELDPAAAAHVIPLLAWDEVAEDAIRALQRAGPSITGQLLDALLDSSQPFSIRRRVPRALAMYPSSRTAQGLLLGLNDKRFEVRYRCGRALLRIASSAGGVGIPPDRVLEAVSRELELGRHLWESHRLLDGGAEDELVGDRANRALEHVFTLLKLILPGEALSLAFRALETSDDMLRGTALEYLETVVPQPVRGLLWPYLEDDRPVRPSPRSRDEILAELMRSDESIEIKLQERKTNRAGSA